MASGGLAAKRAAARAASRPERYKYSNRLWRRDPERLFDLPDARTHKRKRDRTLLALLVACGLRRQELIKATTFGGALSWKFGLAVRHPKQWTIASETVPAAAVGGVSPRHNCSKTIRFSVAKR